MQTQQNENEARARMADEFVEAVKPLHEWLCKYGHPHMRVMVEQDGAHVYEGQFGVSFPVPD